MLLLAPLHAAGSSTHRYKYIIDSANYIFGYESKGNFTSPEQLAHVLDSACSALKVLSTSKDLYYELSTIQAKQTPESLAARKALSTNLSAFAENFMQTEGSQLREAGLSREAAERVLTTTALFRASLDNPIDKKATLLAVSRLRDATCHAENDIRTARTMQTATREFKKWTYRFAGVILIVVDADAELLTATASTASIAIGASVMGWTD